MGVWPIKCVVMLIKYRKFGSRKSHLELYNVSDGKTILFILILARKTIHAYGISYNLLNATTTVFSTFLNFTGKLLVDIVVYYHWFQGKMLPTERIGKATCFTSKYCQESSNQSKFLRKTEDTVNSLNTFLFL